MSTLTSDKPRSITGRNLRGEVIRILRSNLGRDTSVVFEPRMTTRSFIGKGEPVKFTHREITLVTYQPDQGLRHWIARATSDERGRGNLNIVEVEKA